MVINKMLGLITRRPLHWSSNGQQCALLLPLLHKRGAYAPYEHQIGIFEQQYLRSSIQTTPSFIKANSKHNVPFRQIYEWFFVHEMNRFTHTSNPLDHP
jgi:hypothetical protein